MPILSVTELQQPVHPFAQVMVLVVVQIHVPAMLDIQDHSVANLSASHMLAPILPLVVAMVLVQASTLVHVAVDI